MQFLCKCNHQNSICLDRNFQTYFGLFFFCSTLQNCHWLALASANPFPCKQNPTRAIYIECSIYCGFINTVGSYIRLLYFYPFQYFFIHIDKFYLFSIHFSSNLLILYNVKKIVWPTEYDVFSVVNKGFAWNCH
jgi:hypothetical protein